MSTQKIFLASSSELKEDRREFEVFIGRKNKHWAAKGALLELVLWEDFLDAMSRTRLQDEYNQAVRGSDLFVMLFFTKVGPYTAEEFETAFGQFKDMGKPFIFTYFKDAPIHTGSINDDDLLGLATFKKKLKALGHFPTLYKNIEGLLLHFGEQLDKLAANGFIQLRPDRSDALRSGDDYHAVVHGGGSAAQGQDAMAVGAAGVVIGGPNAGVINTGSQIITHYHAAIDGQLTPEHIARHVTGYLRWLRARTEFIELRGVERAGGAPVVLLPLETAYVPLRSRWMRCGTDVALNQVLGLGHRLVIVGGPGSGKTTVLLHMAWALASSLLSGQAEPARSRLGPLMRPNGLHGNSVGNCEPSELPLPIVVPLASFARYRRMLAKNAPAKERTLAHFIAHHLISKQADFDIPPDFFAQLLKDGRNVLLLLDGLDEVANEDERAEVRQSMEELVAGRENLRVVVTCRAVAYFSGRTALGAQFREINVQPLDFEKHIVPMVRKAYSCIYPYEPAEWGRRSENLLRGIKRLEADRRSRLGGRADALVDSPLLVRLLLIVHFNDKKLPDERAELFEKAINALLQVDYGREESDIRELSAGWKLYRDMAQQLAFHMHLQGRDQGREIDELALKNCFSENMEIKGRIDDFLIHARQRGSVLEERGGVYRFIHLAFQEFLVARYLREVIGSKGQDAILEFLDSRLEDPWWREPILLLAGHMAVNATRSARDFVNALARGGGNPSARFFAAELAGVAALEWRRGGNIRANCARHIVELLSDKSALLDSSPILRARVGDVLARLGDPRFDPQRFHLPADDQQGFVRIPADPDFVIGTRNDVAKRFPRIVKLDVPDNELNDVLTPTPEFYVARYPVTVAQFRAFVEATQFEVGEARALDDPDNRPVRWISWYEALAYCEWLNECFAYSPVFAGSEIARLVRECGWRIGLPSELEWEKAARGGVPETVFGWGDEPDHNRANCEQTGVGDTTAVGCFPANGYDLHDMIGNLWEWTRSLWGQDWRAPKFGYPYDSSDACRENLEAGIDLFRVLRGGSWNRHRVEVRCAYRYWLPPVDRDGLSGFRVVLCSGPVS